MARASRQLIQDIVTRSARAGVTGGHGSAIRQATKVATQGAVSAAAQRAAAAYKKRKEAKAATPPQKPPKKMTGFGFYLMVGLTLIKDISDIFADLTVVLSVLTTVTTIGVSFVVAFYLILNNVKPTTRKVATYLITFIIELIPFANLLPTSFINLIMIRSLENNTWMSRALDSVGKTFGFASKVGV